MAQEEENVVSNDDEFDNAFDDTENEELKELESDTSDNDAAEDDESDEFMQEADELEEDQAAGDGVDPGTQDTDDNTDDNDQDSNSEGETLEEQLERLKAENESLTQKTKSWDGRLSAKDRELEDLRQKLESNVDKATQKAEDGESDVSDEDVDEAEAKLEQFYEDFPALREPLEIISKRNRQAAVQEATGKVDKVVEPFTKERAEREQREIDDHVNAINDAHPDWQDVARSDEFSEFIDNLPYRKALEAKSTLNEGNAKEINDLLTSYKVDAGIIEDAGDTTQNDDSDKELTAAERRKAKALENAAAVKSSKANSPKGGRGKSSSFDDAFDEAPDD